MSNYLSIATVTAALRDILDSAAKAAVDGAEATSERPDVAKANPKPCISLFLYQVAPNPDLRNADLPTRRNDGSLSRRPQTALDLFYLLTFIGNDKMQEPQRMMGNAMSALHAQPILSQGMIQKTIDAAVSSDSNHYLKESDLAAQIETVKFTPMSLNLEELSKLWSVFFQTPYSLSVAYRVSAILIEADLSPRQALPVRGSGFYPGPFRQPSITEIVSQAGSGQPILGQGTIVVKGRNLKGDGAVVLINGTEMTLDPDTVSNTEIPIDLGSQTDKLRAGVQGVQVLHGLMIGDPPTAHRAVASNVAPFVLRPEIKATDVGGLAGPPAKPRSGDLKLTLSPKVGKAQPVILLLNELNPPPDRAPHAYTFEASSRKSDAATVTVPVKGVAAGNYLVRVRVDGAENPLQTDPATGLYSKPKVTVP